ncbi:hypothetical protein BGZ95_006072 [Linnemannia exigua]|uniref:RRM domain-containing protein n=1 Tax=Linnemannia exigua TaxID=604196 RepID=A0AAD4H9J7_9FUNG|nr:hypothetical protein BGZ95_006072 [Linnemannia exigua]
MKRSNDYAQHDAFKKPRVAQGYNNSHNNSGLGGPSADIYGANSYGANPVMMGGYGQMGGSSSGGSQYGGQYGSDLSQSLNAPYQQFTTPSFGANYGHGFQMSFPPATSAGSTGSRTVYLGNVSAESTIEDVLNLVRNGIVENARLLPEKSCAFISFLDSASANAFHYDATSRKLELAGQELRVGWGKPSPVPPQVLQAVQQGATRNVFLGGVDESVTEQSLRADFSQFGTIDTIKVLREKSIAFVHFSNIGNAMKAIAALSQDSRYSRRRMNYGKDRCAKKTVNGTPGMPNAFAFGGAGYSQYGSSMPLSFNPNFDRFPQQGGRSNFGHGNNHLNNGGNSHHNFNNGNANSMNNNNNGALMSGPFTAQGNRTVYLGNIGPDTTCEDLCNAIRGGILNNIRYFPAKHIAFVSFVDPQAANNFFNQCNHQGVMVKSRRLKAGWGQNMHALPLPVIQALQTGATRNVYLGSIDEGFTEERLRHDFAEFGEIEMVNILQDKNCGFVNYTNILSAVKAVDGIRRNPAYEKVKINFGKDRCGNPPKMNNNSNSHSNHSNNNSNNHNNNNNNRSNHSVNHMQDESNGQDHEASQGVQAKIEDSPSDIKAFEEDEDMFQIGV